MTQTHHAYLPAFGRDALLPLYDPVVRLFGADRARETLIAQADIHPGHQLLDVGCGTGTLPVQIKRRTPDTEVTGIDPDPKALARCRRKAQRAGIEARFDQGFADALPYADASFDRVFSSLMFHHLPRDVRLCAMQEAYRVLRPGGALHMLDFAGPAARANGRIARVLHSNPQLRDNDEDQVLGWMHAAGFDARSRNAGRLLVGHIIYYEALRPAV